MRIIHYGTLFFALLLLSFTYTSLHNIFSSSGENISVYAQENSNNPYKQYFSNKDISKLESFINKLKAKKRKLSENEFTTLSNKLNEKLDAVDKKYNNSMVSNLVGYLKYEIKILSNTNDINSILCELEGNCNTSSSSSNSSSSNSSSSSSNNGSSSSNTTSPTPDDNTSGSTNTIKPTPDTITTPDQYIKYNDNGAFDIKITGYKGCQLYSNSGSNFPTRYANGKFKTGINGSSIGKPSSNGIFTSKLRINTNHPNYKDLYLSILCYTDTYKKNGKDYIDFSSGKYLLEPKKVSTFSQGLYSSNFTETAIPGSENNSYEKASFSGFVGKCNIDNLNKQNGSLYHLEGGPTYLCDRRINVNGAILSGNDFTLNITDNVGSDGTLNWNCHGGEIIGTKLKKLDQYESCSATTRCTNGYNWNSSYAACIKETKMKLDCTDNSSAAQTYKHIGSRCGEPAGIKYWNAQENYVSTFMTLYRQDCQKISGSTNHAICNNKLLCESGATYIPKTNYCKK